MSPHKTHLAKHLDGYTLCGLRLGWVAKDGLARRPFIHGKRVVLARTWRDATCKKCASLDN